MLNNIEQQKRCTIFAQGVLQDVGTQTEKAYLIIKQKILEGIYKPSEKLIESHLAKELGVSRNTIKKAFLMLEKEKLIELEENKGAKIKSFTLQEVNNYLEIRAALEGVIIRSAVPKIANEDLHALQEILDHMKSCIEGNHLDEYSKLNKEFHQTIYKAAQNEQAVELVSMIKTQLIRYHFRTILVPGRNQSSFEEHTAIFNALQKRDADEAEAAIKRHILNIRKTINDYYHFLV